MSVLQGIIDTGVNIFQNPTNDIRMKLGTDDDFRHCGPQLDKSV